MDHSTLKGLSHLVQSCLLYRSCMSKDSARSTGHAGHFFPKKYCVAFKKSTLKVLINLVFVTSFEDSHYILLFRYIYGAQLIQWFWYSKHLHVNRDYRPNGTATSLSPKCYSANVPLVNLVFFCKTADFEIKYFFNEDETKFWVIPNWFSIFCSQNGYLNWKLMLTLASGGGGGLMQPPPHEFFWAAR